MYYGVLNGVIFNDPVRMTLNPDFNGTPLLGA